MRTKFIYLCVALTLLVGAIGVFYPGFLWAFVIIIPIILLGIKDMIQTKHSLIRNFPVVGRMRWWAEWMRPKIYQYFIKNY